LAISGQLSAKAEIGVEGYGHNNIGPKFVHRIRGLLLYLLTKIL
jgi:hypothetical protein